VLWARMHIRPASLCVIEAPGRDMPVRGRRRLVISVCSSACEWRSRANLPRMIRGVLNVLEYGVRPAPRQGGVLDVRLRFFRPRGDFFWVPAHQLSKGGPSGRLWKKKTGGISRGPPCGRRWNDPYHTAGGGQTLGMSFGASIPPKERWESNNCIRAPRAQRYIVVLMLPSRHGWYPDVSDAPSKDPPMT